MGFSSWGAHQVVGHLRVPLLVLPVPLVMSIDACNKYCVDAYQSTVRIAYNDVNQRWRNSSYALEQAVVEPISTLWG
jgi:hypothetical protein